MAINETISTGNKYRRLKDASTKLWQRLSFWTKASDVEFDNGATAETSLGNSQGIKTKLLRCSRNKKRFLYFMSTRLIKFGRVIYF